LVGSDPVGATVMMSFSMLERPLGMHINLLTFKTWRAPEKIVGAVVPTLSSVTVLQVNLLEKNIYIEYS